MDATLKKEIIELILEELQQDSITIGNSKTGEVKVYVNFDNPGAAENKILNAITILKNNRAKVLGE